MRFLGECDCGCAGECRYARVVAYRPVRGHVPIDPPCRADGPGLVYGNGSLDQGVYNIITRIFPLNMGSDHVALEGTDGRQQRRFRRSRWTAVGSGSGHATDVPAWTVTVDREVVVDRDEKTNVLRYRLRRNGDAQTTVGFDPVSNNYRSEWSLSEAGVLLIDAVTGSESTIGSATLATVAQMQQAITDGWVSGHSRATYTAGESSATLVIDIAVTWEGGATSWSVTYSLELVGGLTFDEAADEANGLIDAHVSLQELGTQQVAWTHVRNAEGYWVEAAGPGPLDWLYTAEIAWAGPYVGMARQLVIRRSGPDVSGAFVSDPRLEWKLTHDTGFTVEMYPGSQYEMWGLTAMVSRVRLNDGWKSVVGLRNCAWVWPHWDPAPSSVLENYWTPEVEDNGTPAPSVTWWNTRIGTKSCVPDFALGDFIVRWDALVPAPDPPPAIPEVAVGTSDWGDAWVMWACGHKPPVKDPGYAGGFDYTICCGWGEQPVFDADTLDIDADDVNRMADETAL